MPLSRKDFVAVAQILRENQVPPPLVKEFANWLATTSPRFDRERFMAAATGETAPQARPGEAPGRVDPALDATQGDLVLPWGEGGNEYYRRASEASTGLDEYTGSFRGDDPGSRAWLNDGGSSP